MLWIVRITRLSRAEKCELSGYRFAHDHRTGATQQRHHGGVARRRTSGVNWRTILRRHIGRIENIFDRDRYAVKRSNRLTFEAVLIERARLRQRILWIEKCPGSNVLVDRMNLCQAGFDELLRIDYTVANQPRRFRRREQVKID